MLSRILSRIDSMLVSPQEVAAYEHLIPRTISISYKKDRGYIIGYINEVDGELIKGLLMTQGKTPDEFVANINQLAYMQARVPEKVRPYYGNVFNFSNTELHAKSGDLVLQKA